MNRALVESGYEMILQGLFGLDYLKDPHLKGTAGRAARAMMDELCVGLQEEAEPSITTFDFAGDTGLILLRDIPVKSLCAHHLLPFTGVAHVGYIGSDQVIGLSKLSRVVNFFSRRPQVQEVLTRDIADYLHTKIANPFAGVPLAEIKGGAIRPRGVGVGVVVQANHMCMALRGVNHDGNMVTSALRGVMQDAEVRAEFLKLTGV